MYKRILVFGGTGSGKTTLARKLSRSLKIPCYSTDQMVYKKLGRVKYPEKERIEKLKQTAKKTKWIIEGVQGDDWLIPAVKRADFIIILDFRKLTLFKRVIKRYFQRKKRYYDSPKDLARMIYFASLYKRGSYLEHKEYIRKNKKDHIILKNNEKVEEFLSKI